MSDRLSRDRGPSLVARRPGKEAGRGVAKADSIINTYVRGMVKIAEEHNIPMSKTGANIRGVVLMREEWY